MAHTCGPSPIAYAAMKAITRAKVVPAYAHSFNSGSPGNSRTMAAAGLAKPERS